MSSFGHALVLALAACAGLATGAPSSGPEVDGPVLLEAPVGLGWSAAEVERAGLASLRQTLDRAAAAGRLGCERRCDQVERVVARLLPVARAQSRRAAGLAWQVHVVRLDDVDAFAMPDGAVVVSEQLLVERDLSDEALAFVIAHEMSHAILEHERQALTFGRLLLPREVPRSVQDMYVEMQFNAGMLRALSPVLHQGEFEADEAGLLMAASAGFRPSRQLEFMQHEVVERDPRRPIVSTHPDPRDRLARLEALQPLALRLHAQAGSR